MSQKNSEGVRWRRVAFVVIVGFALVSGWAYTKDVLRQRAMAASAAELAKAEADKRADLAEEKKYHREKFNKWRSRTEGLDFSAIAEGRQAMPIDRFCDARESYLDNMWPPNLYTAQEKRLKESAAFLEMSEADMAKLLADYHRSMAITLLNVLDAPWDERQKPFASTEPYGCAFLRISKSNTASVVAEAEGWWRPLNEVLAVKGWTEDDIKAMIRRDFRLELAQIRKRTLSGEDNQPYRDMLSLINRADSENVSVEWLEITQAEQNRILLQQLIDRY